MTERDSISWIEPQRRRVSIAIMSLVWCSFFIYGVLAAPVPGPNEPHYLTKARHYWQSDWCHRDFFLASSNPHAVFYWTVGSLTPWLSFEATAWIGRAVAMAILAWGWCSFLSRLDYGRWFALQVCWGFLLLQSVGNFSGEWIVGGVEGKVFAYGFVLAALGQLHDWESITLRRAVGTGLCAGLAIAFHPVIGIWSLLAFLGVLFIQLCRDLVSPARRCDTLKTQVVNSIAGTVTLGIVALPGLAPVFQLLSEDVPVSTQAAANYIQVYYRLAHHLDPMRFLPRAYWCYALLIIVWILLMWQRRSAAHRRFDLFVLLTVLFAIVGIAIGWGPRPAQAMTGYAQRASLLKFYPFRLADALVPLATSVSLLAALAKWPWSRSRAGNRTKFVAVPSSHPAGTIAMGLCLIAALCLAGRHAEVNRYSGELRTDWLDACRWIDSNLPADALILTPHNGWAFKWFAHRAEYVAFKDCPQDAKGIVEWNRRLNFLKRWFETRYEDQLYSASELKQLRAATGITHLLTDRLGPLELQPIYRNATFQVYDLTSLD